MPGRRRLSLEKKLQIKELNQQGMLQTEIARVLGVSQPTVSNVLNTPDEELTDGKSLTDAQVQDIRYRVFVNNETQLALAKEFGVSQPTISKVCRGQTHRKVQPSAKELALEETKRRLKEDLAKRLAALPVVRVRP